MRAFIEIAYKEADLLFRKIRDKMLLLFKNNRQQAMKEFYEFSFVVRTLIVEVIHD